MGKVLLIALVLVISIIVVILLIRRYIRERVEAAQFEAMSRATGRILHEVKNPLQTILLHSEMLADDLMVSDPQARREVCGAIIGEASRVAGLLSHLTTFASGIGSQLIAVPAPLHEVVQGVVSEVAEEYAEAGIDLRLGVVEEIMTSGDNILLREALGHLVQNAYDALVEESNGCRGEIRIGVRRRGRSAVIEIQDSGPGLPPDRLGEFLRPFVTTRSSGLGLGLPLAKVIAEGHGGRLELSSRPGEGLRATLSLPIQIPDRTRTQPA